MIIVYFSLNQPQQTFKVGLSPSKNFVLIEKPLRIMKNAHMQTGVRDCFLFCVDFELSAKIKKDLVFTHSCFTFLLITQDLNKKKKIPSTIFCRHFKVENVCRISAKNFVVAGARQGFQFFR